MVPERLKKLKSLLEQDIRSLEYWVRVCDSEVYLTPEELRGSFTHQLLKVRKQQLSIVNQTLAGEEVILHKFPRW